MPSDPNPLAVLLTPRAVFPPLGSRDDDLSPAILLLIFLASFVILYISAFLHELGHAVMGWCSGFEVTSFGVGLGRFFWVGGWRGTRIYLGLSKNTNAVAVFVSPQLYPTRRQMVAVLSGGILAHALLVLAGLALWWNVSWGSLVWMLVALVNGLAFVVNLVPMQVRVGSTSIRSDGRRILEVLRLGMPAPDLAAQLGTLRVFRSVWEAVGDVRGHYHHLLDAALAWVKLGNAARAQELVDTAGALPLVPTLFDRAYGSLVGALTACAADKATVAEEALEEAVRRFTALRHEAGLFQVGRGRAELLARQGNAPAALRELEALERHPIAAGRPLLAAGLLVSRLCVLAGLPEAPGVDSLLEVYEDLRKRYPSAVWDLRVYQAIAAHRERLGQTAAAAEACTKALEAAQLLDGSLEDETDRAHFREGQAGLLERVRGLWRQLGRETGPLDVPWTDPAQRQREKTVREERRQRRLHRLGWLITAFNLVLAAGLVAFLVLRQPPGRGALLAVRPEDLSWLSLAAALLGGVVLVALFDLGRLLLCWAFFGGRRAGGAVVLSLALVPYGAWLWSLTWS